MGHIYPVKTERVKELVEKIFIYFFNRSFQLQCCSTCFLVKCHGIVAISFDLFSFFSCTIVLIVREQIRFWLTFYKVMQINSIFDSILKSSLWVKLLTSVSLISLLVIILLRFKITAEYSGFIFRILSGIFSLFQPNESMQVQILRKSETIQKMASFQYLIKFKFTLPLNEQF